MQETQVHPKMGYLPFPWLLFFIVTEHRFSMSSKSAYELMNEGL